ncbi:MAG: ribonuclease HII [bacterium]
MNPTRRQENILRKQGYQKIAGVDEVGRGAWAGPLVAAAVILPVEFKLIGLKDSKQLSPALREQFFLKIINNASAWAVGLVSEKTIDQHGLTYANLLAMEQAINRLAIAPDYILLDAFNLKKITLPQKAIIKGDQKIYCIAAASIVAKVFRDNLLKRFHRTFPQYNFARHKGYGTREHYELICQHGICELHRQSFRPFNSLVE